MGNRDALLAAARTCLATNGYAHTSARDIATTAGVSLAAIGYHFGSTDRLLTEAVFLGIQDWAADLGRLLARSRGPRDESPRERFTRIWGCVIDSFQSHRPALAASYAVMASADDSPDVRRRLADGIDDARRALAALLAGVDSDTEPDRARQVGAFCYTILGGLLTQWLVDPARAPSAADITAALGYLDIPAPPKITSI